MNGEIVDAKVCAALARGPMTQRELEDASGVCKFRVFRSLRRLMQCGEVVRDPVPKGPVNAAYRYRLADVAELVEHDENEPFAFVAGARDARKAANQFLPIVSSARNAMLVRAPTGEVYALRPSGPRADAVYAHQSGWVIGTYNAGCDVSRVALDIRAQACGVMG